MRDWDEPKYPISVSTAVAGQKLATGRLWYSKRWLFSRTDHQARVPGATSLVSSRSVLAHAIAASLAAIRTPPELACKAARTFTDFADESEAPGFTRNPGELFEGSFTYLAVYPDGQSQVIRTAGIRASRRNPATGKRETVIEKPTVQDLLLGIGQRDGCWLLPLDFIFKHVVVELDKFDAAHQAA